MEKQQVQPNAQKKPEPANDKKAKGKLVSEKQTLGISLPNLDDKFTKDLSKIAALTPYLIATRFNVRLREAREILEELERRRLVKSEGGNARIKTCRIAAA